MSSRTAKPVMPLGFCATKSSRIYRRAHLAGQTQQHVRREESKNRQVPANRGLEQRLARDRVVEDGGARLYLCFSALFLEKGGCLPVPSTLGPMPVKATNPVRLHMPHVCRIQLATHACSLPVLAFDAAAKCRQKQALCAAAHARATRCAACTVRVHALRR
jgi:hypothetical protein